MSAICISVGQDYNSASVERHEFTDFAALGEYIREQQSRGGFTGPYLCAPMVNGHRKAECAEPTTVLAIDFDTLPPEAPRKLCEAITEAGWRAALWTTRKSTPEAPRIRIVLELDRAVGKPEYAKVYRAAVRHLGEVTGLRLEADDACEKPEQPAILPQPSSTLWMQIEGVPLNVDAFIAYDPVPRDDDDRPRDDDDDRDDGRFREGGRNEALSRLAFKLRKAGLEVGELEAALLRANRQRCRPPLADDEVRKIAAGKGRVQPDEDPGRKDDEPLALVAFDLTELLQPIPPERDLIAGMIPTEAYTVFAGALSAGKTTAAHLLILSRATGFDLLQLEAHFEVGPCVVVSYEDSDHRIRRKLLTCIQWGHQEVQRVHGARAAEQFLALVVKNVRRLTLTGQRGSALVCRDLNGNAAANMAQIEAMLTGIRSFADRELLIGIDPLRLAFRGSQNDDDGADVTVETLNMLACAFPDSALVVPTHTTKAGAIEPGSDRTSQAYATSGSALYSQHARSNFHLARPKPDDARRLVRPDFVTEEELTAQRLTVLSHARLSHGTESKVRVYAMRKGVLVPVPGADQSETVFARAKRLMPALAETVRAIELEGGKVTANGLEEDAGLRRRAGRNELRQAIRQAVAQGWLAEDGNTRNRRLTLTDAGREFAPVAQNLPARKSE